jgi:DNA polymerase-1
MSGQEKILLIDSNAVIHRSFHALPPLTSPKGELVNAVYGFANTLLKAINDEKPDYVVACYDAGRETFRNEIFDGYKANRKETDEALYSQIPRTTHILESLSIPIYVQKGVEADDLIGSLTEISHKKGLEVVIVTGDKDSLQLVRPGVSVYSLHRGASDILTYHRDTVKEKMGVFPEQVVDFKALAGDASDNIPGAPGVGPKTAVDLLNKYQNLAGVYDHLEELPERLGRILKENKHKVQMSQKLAQIKLDLDVELDLPKADVNNFDFTHVVNLFHELGFKSLLMKLPKANQKVQGTLFTDRQNDTPSEQKKLEKTVPQLPYEAVTDLKRFSELMEVLKKQPVLVLDTETVNLHGQLIGISFAWGPNDAAYIPVGPVYDGGLPFDDVKKDLGEILADPEIRKIGHNIKYDLEILERAGLPVRGIWFDTMLASQLVNSQLFSHRLDDVAFAELGFKKIATSELIGPKKDALMTSVPLDKLAAYACEDALITWRLYEHYKPDLEAQHLKKIFYEVEMPLTPILQKMEEQGIMIDLPYLKKFSAELTEQLSGIEQRIKKLAGVEFNVASPAQLKEVLFNKLRLPATGLKKVKTGYSTDAESLGRLKDKHEIIAPLLEHREISKLLNTYIDTLPKLADKNGRVHTSFMQMGAATGRLSSQNPNLQNIPIRTELGNKVRRAFVPSSGKVLLGADYSQAELRIVAHLANDPDLIKAFNQGDDFHAAVAKQLGVDRRAAKAINFGIIYGLGPNGLANDLDIKIDEAREFIDRYFDRFPGVRDFTERMKNEAREKGYTETIFGRRRYLPDIHAPNPMLRSGAERMAVNMPAQGSVADIMKLAMIQVDKVLPKTATMLLQIHDELLLEVEENAVKEVTKIVSDIMDKVVELKVPLFVDVATGPNWADLKKK